MSAQPDFTSLSDEELTGICETKMVRIESVERLDALVEPLGGIPPFIGDHTTFSRTGSSTSHRCATSQCGFGLITQGTKTHSRNINGNIKFQGAFGFRANHGFGVTLFPVSLNDEPCQGAWHKSQVIPGRDFFEKGEATHSITSKLGLDMNVVDHLWFEDETFS